MSSPLLSQYSLEPLNSHLMEVKFDPMEPKSWLSVGWLPTWITTQKTALPTD